MATQDQTILLIDDSETDALLIEQAFGKAQIRNPFVHLATASEAFEYFHKFQKTSGSASAPALFVLLDLKLPDVSGYEILSWIRHHNSYRKLPVIVVTDSRDPSDEEKSLRLGANGFYRKSVSFEDLAPLVRSAGAFWLLQTPPDSHSPAAPSDRPFQH